MLRGEQSGISQVGQSVDIDYPYGYFFDCNDDLLGPLSK